MSSAICKRHHTEFRDEKGYVNNLQVLHPRYTKTHENQYNIVFNVCFSTDYA